MNNRKRFVQKELDYDLDWDYSVSIEHIKKDIVELEKLGATHVMIDSRRSYDDTFTDFKAVTNRLETDEEVLERENQEKRMKENLEAKERELYEQLKKKYE